MGDKTVQRHTAFNNVSEGLVTFTQVVCQRMPPLRLTRGRSSGMNERQRAIANVERLEKSGMLHALRLCRPAPLRCLSAMSP